MADRWDNCRHEEGRHHDCDYVSARNRLIPRALVEAEMAVAQEVPGHKRDLMFARAFFSAMNKLAGTPSPSEPEQPAEPRRRVYA